MATILGKHTLGTAMLYEVDTNPTTGGGIAASIGDFAIAKDGSGFFYKSGATNTDWEKGTTSGDLGGYNVLLVRKNPSVGEYATINAAIAAIGVSSSSNRYVIQVGVGTFIESYIDLSSKPYVSIVGTSIESTIIQPDANNHDIINIGEGNELSFFTLQNAGVGYWGITMIDTGNYGQAHKISFDDCDGNIYIKSITQDTFFYGEYVDFNGVYTTGLKVESTNGFRCFANMENYYNYPDVTATIVGTYVTGTNADCHVLTSGHTTDSNGTIESGLGTAFYEENGANLQIAATDIQGFNKGIWIANVGAASNISADAVLSLLNTTYDVQIEHPSATGTIGGTFDNSKIVVASGATVGLLAQDATNGSLLITNKLNVLYKNGTVTDVSTLISEGSTMGVEEGGVLSDGGGFVVDISLGYGYFEQFPDNDVIQRIDWANTSITLSANVDKYIYFNNNGLLVSNGAEPDTRYNILLGRVVTNGTGIEFIDASPSDAEHTSNLISNNLKNAIGSVYASGSITTENVTPLHLDVTGGEYYFGENVFNPQGGTNITFTEIYGGGSGVITGQNAVNNTQYDNAGVLTSLTSGYFAKGSIYLVGQGVNQKFYFVFAQSQYSTLLAAQQANIPTPPTSFKGSVVLIAGIIVQQGNANIVQIIDERPIVGFRASGVNASADHLSLLNLNAGTDGDGGHTNMFVVSGAKAMTGNLDMGSNNVFNAGTFNSVVVQAHASRHLPNGADPLTTAAPTTNLSGSTSNSVGIQNSFSRSDHSHAITGAAITKTDDTNITLTLGGSFNTALLNASSLTLGWNGQLSVARGGTGVDGSAYTDAGLFYYDLASTSFKNSSLFSYAFTNNPTYGINGSNANPIKGETTINNTITVNSWDGGGIYSNSISNIFFNDGTGARDLVLEYQDNIGASGTITIVDSLSNGLFQYTPDAGMFVSVKAPNVATLKLTNTDDGAQLNFTTRNIAPTTPNNGDMWVDLTGLKYRKSSTTVDLSGTVIATRGGTGQTVYAVGDILFANTTTSLSKLSDVATGNALISGGVGVAPSYGKIGLTTHVSGTLGATNGGTSFNTYATGDILYSSATNVLSKLAIGSTGQVLTVVGGVPTWSSGGTGTVTSVSVVTANGVSGSVATATTTPAITLTLGAITPTSVNGNTLTTGTGTLTLSTFTLTVGGTSSINGTFSGTSSGTNTGDQTITLTGEATGTGTGSFAVTLTNSAVIGKVLTGYVSGAGVVSPTDSILSAIQKLNGNISALVTGVSSVSGTTNRIAVSPTSGAVIVDIDAAYVGQSSITTIGTITSGGLGTGAVIGGVTMTLGSDATGDVYYRNSSGVLTRLGIGSTGNVLTVSGGLPSWASPTAITTYPYAAKTTTYLITATDFSIDCTSGTFTVTLPTAVGITGKVYVITNSGTGVITLAANGAETITGSNTLTLKVQYQSLTVQSNGTGWILI